MLLSDKIYNEIDNVMLEIESVIILVALVLLGMPSNKLIASHPWFLLVAHCNSSKLGAIAVVQQQIRDLPSIRDKVLSR